MRLPIEVTNVHYYGGERSNNSLLMLQCKVILFQATLVGGWNNYEIY
ncbi:hypothetical protein PB1_12984 [Bacillus methanolicus PB1]|uniref:Uncharacterized protein n=1 Tax=Bacillus methanolicus PB1 TaxID=997296 RepID=I3DW52_BACMT|nr:hypothetical protein PB1_12984 [Bacillus methanolicus PB1]